MASRKKYDKSVYRALALITQFGINMLVPIFLLSFLGIWLDKKLGTSYLMILFFFIGALAGFRNIYVMAKHIYEDKDGDAHDGKT
ncbi:MAG: AtpZ/AtpI family protein [Lachnospiraceae bacterium]|nr:AtpZ/AtpI family protein [Lachnospiraceae bacterium]